MKAGSLCDVRGFVKSFTFELKKKFAPVTQTHGINKMFQVEVSSSLVKSRTVEAQDLVAQSLLSVVFMRSMFGITFLRRKKYSAWRPIALMSTVIWLPGRISWLASMVTSRGVIRPYAEVSILLKPRIIASSDKNA